LYAVAKLAEQEAGTALLPVVPGFLCCWPAASAAALGWSVAISTGMVTPSHHSWWR